MYVVSGKFEDVLWLDDDGRIQWITTKSMEPLSISIHVFIEMIDVMIADPGLNSNGPDFITHCKLILGLYNIYFGDDIV